MKGDRGDAGAMGAKGRKGDPVPYHVPEDRSSIVELIGVSTLHCVSAYHDSAWHFDAKVVNGEGQETANVQKESGHPRVQEMKNSAYYCLYDLASNKVNAIYMVYHLRNYDANGTEHNYLFSSGMGNNHRDVCFLQDEKAIRVHGDDYMDISNSPTSYYIPCQNGR